MKKEYNPKKSRRKSHVLVLPIGAKRRKYRLQLTFVFVSKRKRSAKTAVGGANRLSLSSDSDCVRAGFVRVVHVLTFMPVYIRADLP